MSTEQKVFGRHPVTGIVAEVRPIELAIFGMVEVPAHERTGKPVINAKVRKGDDIIDDAPQVIPTDAPTPDKEKK